jgi:hypothetical protein
MRIIPKTAINALIEKATPQRLNTNYDRKVFT